MYFKKNDHQNTMSHSNLVNFYLCIILCHITCLNIKEDCHQPLPLSEYWVETYSGTLSISHLCSMESINVKFNLKSSKKVLHYYTKSRKLHKGNDFRTKEGYLIFKKEKQILFLKKHFMSSTDSYHTFWRSSATKG